MLQPLDPHDRYINVREQPFNVRVVLMLSNHGITVLIAVLIHLSVFFILLMSWQQDPKNILSQLAVVNNAQPAMKLNAYFISERKLNAQMSKEKKQATPEQEPMAVIIKTTQQTLTETLDDGNLKNQPKKTSEPKKQSTPKLIQQPKQQYQKANKIISSQLGSSENIKTSAKNNSPKVSASQLLEATQRYLHGQADKNFEAMSQSRVREASHYGASLSEMTPEMPRYQVKIIEDKTQPTTSNHRLDPNRRVKIGDTCYKVVNLSTQINPHGEGLGFAEPCDPVSATKRSLDAAISNRLSKMKLK
ncbi:hypothetical protein Sden_1769 [Shewanella denitrificans OS217]|jgi:hypothetical protein|uniref:Uncharacterized protein n=2 Tax=Shewanella TaxID=22 RepID=Q12NC3_SHEDO|nr:hypothetical protein [Shewanella denitrificans]ABE55053.1 hypothetical protein Sden_1769 [Shewanella denitrificans OS217]